MIRYILLGVLFSACTKPAPVERKGPWTFQAAKKAAERSIFHDYRVTFYCGCAYDQHGKVNAKSCGYKPRLSITRGSRIEWEHIVPAAAFGQHRACWKGCGGLTGRACCRKTDPQFRMMEADLHNLVPAVGELNGDRSNLPYGEVQGEPRAYGKCDFEVDFVLDVVEPVASLRGNIARVYLYMHKAYPGGLPLTGQQLATFRAWSKADPVDAWEHTRWTRVEAVQKR